MYRSRCSTQSLELLINDFAGINIRQQRAKRFFQHYRTFGTRPGSQQQPEVVEVEGGGAVPFDSRVSLPEGGRYAGLPISRGSRGGAGDGEGVIEESSAGAKIMRPASGAVSGKEDGLDTETREESTVDRVLTQGLDSSTAQQAKDAMVPPLIGPAVETGGKRNEDGSAGAVTGNRAASRIARKLRREAAGTYKAFSDAEKKEREHQLRINSVMAKIDELEDPMKGRREALEKFKKQQARKQGGQKVGKELKKQIDTVSGKDSARQEVEAVRSKKEEWQIQKSALKHKFGEAGWQPRKRLSPDTMEGIRALHASDPAAYTNATLAEHFKISPEAIRRILKSKWRPNDVEAEDRRIRWERRGAKKWEQMAAQGVRPPAKWRAMGASAEGGLKDEKMPKRRRRRAGDVDLSWDAISGGEAQGPSFADRIL
ncbi:hypothetical protein B0A50_01153 [Salinomyces thailandicus]|uniref:Required for respiratory growth protein 9, mitochondrial n=1 Tax=Salinomyces thailandicus TaxID=706561 RepID=A0A4U0UCK4_9PEZI|nr:hypothetical protein B0A50_01153 [Salinomyces thailandica]